jgi:nanoRNase/pAp phosphatase (c-di-AMP/oligoRNAs hydrolase)
VMVDSQPAHNSMYAGYRFDVVIDHHPDMNPPVGYKDIRPGYGATATILTEYLRAARIKPSAKLATGLYYAIKCDTGNFKRQATLEDVKAFQYLFKQANMHLARRLEQADLKLEFLAYFQVALERKTIRKSRLFVHMGAAVNPDICVLLADFFMRVSSINWTIVSCIYENKLVVIIRSDGLHKNAGTMANRCFGSYGSAGGHKSMARAEIILSTLPADFQRAGYRKQARWIIRQVEKS